MKNANERSDAGMHGRLGAYEKSSSREESWSLRISVSKNRSHTSIYTALRIRRTCS